MDTLRVVNPGKGRSVAIHYRPGNVIRVFSGPGAVFQMALTLAEAKELALELLSVVYQESETAEHTVFRSSESQDIHVSMEGA